MGKADPEERVAKGKEAKKPNQKQGRPKKKQQKRAGLEWARVPLWHLPQRRADSLGETIAIFFLNFELDFFHIINCLFIDGMSIQLSEGSNI